MLNALLMILCFAVLTGIAMLVYSLTKMTGVESMGCSVAAIIVLQFAAALAGNPAAGTYLLYVIALLGILLFIVPKWQKRDKIAFFSPGYAVMALGFTYALVAFQGVFLHNWDEFIQWGYAVRYMYETNLLPVSGAFNGLQPAGTTLFHYFFVRTAGFSDSNLYVSGFMLVWTGMSLALSKLTWIDWKKALVYSAVMFLGLYALYVYPYMSIYVDMPVAAWAGGICALWYLSDNKKQIIPLILGSLFIIPLFKWAVGPLFAVIMIIFIIVMSITQPKQKEITGGNGFAAFFKKKGNWIYILIPVAGFAALLLWSAFIPKGETVIPGIKNDSFSQLFNLSTYKASETLKAGIEKLFYTNIGRSNLKMSFFVFMSAMLISTLLISFFMQKGRKQYRWMTAFYMAGAVTYFFLLILIYINTFADTESTRAASINRYFSIYAVFGFVFLLSPLLVRENIKKFKIAKTIISILAVVVLLIGLKADFFYRYAFMLKPSEVKYYEDLKRIESVSGDLNRILPSDAKVLMVAQNSEGFSVDVAYYKTFGKIPNSDWFPYAFYSGVNNNQYMYTKLEYLEKLPEYMIQNGYNYLWVYQTDDYFTKTAGEIFHSNIKNGGLYKYEPQRSNTNLELVGSY